MLAFSSGNTKFMSASSSKCVRQSKECIRQLRVKCSAGQRATPNGAAVNRRQLVEFSAIAAVLYNTPLGAIAAAKPPKGFSPFQDRGDGYEFYYPFGWQEVSVKGQDVVFKDVVEPLESVSVSLISTDKETIEEFGDAALVAETLAKQVLTPTSQQVTMVNSEMRDTNGQKYLEFEFLVETPRYKRHQLAVVTVSNGKFYTLTTGANERRWPKMENSLKTTIKSFQMIAYSDA